MQWGIFFHYILCIIVAWFSLFLLLFVSRYDVWYSHVIHKLNESNHYLQNMASTWTKYTDSVFSGKSMIVLVIGGLIAGGILAFLK